MEMFNAPVVEVIKFVVADVITTSDSGSGEGGGGMLYFGGSCVSAG